MYDCYLTEDYKKYIKDLFTESFLNANVNYDSFSKKWNQYVEEYERVKPHFTAKDFVFNIRAANEEDTSEPNSFMANLEIIFMFNYPECVFSEYVIDAYGFNNFINAWGRVFDKSIYGRNHFNEKTSPEDISFNLWMLNKGLKDIVRTMGV